MRDGNLECAIIIVTFNSEKYIAKVIDSVLSFRSSRHGVVVVDNASSDGTLNIVKSYSAFEKDYIVIGLNSNIGFGRANNVGFSTVKADWYFLLNADAWLIRNSISPTIEALRDICVQKKVGVCGIPLIFPDGAPQTFSYSYSSGIKWLLQVVQLRRIAQLVIRSRPIRLRLERTRIFGHFIKSQIRKNIDLDDPRLSITPTGIFNEADWVCGAAMFISSGLIDLSGGFDEAIFLYGEDEDLCITAKKAGFDVVWLDTFPVVHVFGWGSNKSSQIVSDYKFNSLLYFIRKHYSGTASGLLMRLLLSFYVFGILRTFKNVINWKK